MTKLHPYLNFAGNAEEAFTFYPTPPPPQIRTSFASPDFQMRAGAGEDISRLVSEIARWLAGHRTKPKRR